MTTPPQRTTDADGIVRTEVRGGGLRALGGMVLVGLVGLGGWLALQPRAPKSPTPTPETSEPVAAGSPAASPPPAVAPSAAPKQDPLERAVVRAMAGPPPARPAADPAAAEVAPPEDVPPPAGAQKEVYVTDLDPGDGTGIHAFPKPGTKPLKSGLAVPEGFELPPGYLRHYQTTDDGRQLEPILMFHPDYRPLDGNGQPIALPADRIVTPDFAPAGMPLRYSEAPAIRKDLESP